ncbi:endcodes part of kinesin [Chrysochromulina tobinii]|uniref:Endcodes part of kinesin n=1 Tax=Chrysochromulina tobinii TaxID=1460289 RepID=A0A0M0LRK7_9EUKA|nr:endcodes part of kinesin [Chrysochromulina tobinii]|eukprot:KOO53378.1 endcodes part of kinesin [Chrysochromulina sp. CCMP291]
MLREAFEGNDSLLFAYGQVGSGKTYTLYGAEGGLDVARLDGVVPQMVNELFRHTTALEKAGTDKFTVSATLIEAQGQHLVDMLAAYNAQGEPSYVKVTGTLQMVGVKRERVYSGRTFCLLVERAMAQSAFASAGGACHRMLTLTLERKRYVSGELQGEPSTTSIHVVDLAGTENFDLEAAKSSRWLNRGVLAMGRIVLALAEGQSHVPYRDYPLTKLIASVFSSPRAVYTGMLACVHVTEESAIETRNTLEYALQASSTDVADTPGTLAQSTARMEDFTKTRSDEEWLQMINDENDEDEVLNRRSEVIETRSGHVFARACGDAAMPLILYLHGAKADARPSTPPPAELSVDHLLKMPREQGRAVDVLTSHRQSSRGPVSGSSDVGPSAVWNKCVECVARAKQSSTASMLDERRGAAKEAAKEEAEAIAATPADEVTRTTSSSSSVAASRLQNATRRQQRRTIGKPLDRQNASPEARHKTAFALHMRSLAHDADDNDADEGSSGYDDRFFKLRAKVSAALLRRQKELAQIQLVDLERQRRSSFRVVLEYGSIVDSSGKAIIFLGMLRGLGQKKAGCKGPHAPQEYTLCHIGADCTQPSPSKVIDRVTIDTTPETKKDEGKPVDCLYEPSRIKDERLGYTFYKPVPNGKVVVLRVDWAEELGLAPLEIRHRVGRAPRFERRVVVQLPAEMPVLPPGTQATPVVYAERRDKELSGWVQYLTAQQKQTVGNNARVSQGPMVLQTEKGGEKMSASEVTALHKHIESNFDAYTTIGNVGHTQLTLSIAAAHGVPLHRSPTVVPGSPKKRPKKISQGAQEEPTDFYQVAIELPGFGNITTYRKHRGAVVNAEFLEEVISALGKTFAYAVVCSAEAAAGVFAALVDHPHLCSFVVAVEPQVQSMEDLLCVFQPTLLISCKSAPDKHGIQAPDPTAAAAAKTLMHVQHEERPFKAGGRFVDEKLGALMVDFFKRRKWRGQLSGFGMSTRLPLLTRLAGGIKMWKGLCADSTPFSEEEIAQVKRQAQEKLMDKISQGNRSSSDVPPSPGAARPILA